MHERFWIAINGDSCALCSIPLRNPLVTPTPEHLFGFETLEEAQEAREINLTGSARQIKQLVKRLSTDFSIRYIRPKHPQAPTREATAWTDSDEAHDIMQRALIGRTLN